MAAAISFCLSLNNRCRLLSWLIRYSTDLDLPVSKAFLARATACCSRDIFWDQMKKISSKLQKTEIKKRWITLKIHNTPTAALFSPVQARASASYTLKNKPNFLLPARPTVSLRSNLLINYSPPYIIHLWLPEVSYYMVNFLNTIWSVITITILVLLISRLQSKNC